MVEKSGWIVARLCGVAATWMMGKATSPLASIETTVSIYSAEKRTFPTTPLFNQISRSPERA